MFCNVIAIYSGHIVHKPSCATSMKLWLFSSLLISINRVSFSRDQIVDQATCIDDGDLHNKLQSA